LFSSFFTKYCFFSAKYFLGSRLDSLGFLNNSIKESEQEFSAYIARISKLCSGIGGSPDDLTGADGESTARMLQIAPEKTFGQVLQEVPPEFNPTVLVINSLKV